jgi:hypothetical protein
MLRLYMKTTIPTLIKKAVIFHIEHWLRYLNCFE